MNADEQAFLGRGWSFPPTFDAAAGAVSMVREEEDIRQSLHILLSTIPGERVMRPAYGCDLHSHVFDRISGSTVAEIERLIADAILFFEPRIDLEEIRINTDDALEGVLYIGLDYRIRKTNARSNIVYPFYQLEGTNIS